MSRPLQILFMRLMLLIKNGKYINHQSLDDLMINSYVLIPDEEMQQTAKVICRTINSNGNIIVTFYEKPVLNSLVYDVDFPDGAVKHYASNIIAENLSSQIESSEKYRQALDKIVLHSKLVNVVSMKDTYVTNNKEFQKLSQTTIGWEFLIEWKDDSRSCMSLKFFKESNPITVVEYVTTLVLTNEPAFLWWVLYNLNKRDHIISLVNIRVQKRNHRFVNQILNNIKEAISLDEKNGNTLWQDAYEK